MNDVVIMFQYLLDNLPNNWPIQLKLGEYSLDLPSQRGSPHSCDVEVIKVLNTKTFNISDPNVCEKIAEFLMEDEDDVIEINMDTWYRVVGKAMLIDIVQKVQKVLSKIDDRRIKDIDRSGIGAFEHHVLMKERNTLVRFFSELMDASRPNDQVFSDDHCNYVDATIEGWKGLIYELERDGII